MKHVRWVCWLVLGCLAGEARAWGPEGHRVVAHIAELRLTDEARLALSRLLLSDQQISDNMICNWPDYVRKERPETAPWHYVDIPVGATAYDADAVCPGDQCVVGQIPLMAKRLADTTLPADQRLEALRFLVHFVGDLHQPLHCADNEDDRGGNERPVRYPGQDKPTNLHAVWDFNLVQAAKNTLGPLEYGDALKADISWWQDKRWSRGTVESWAWESHQLAITHVYTVTPAKGGPPIEIDQAYIRKGKRVVERQLMKAGVRLSGLLNEAFSGSGASRADDAARGRDAG